jgi:non-specific serine/threonine protein kinase
LGKHDYSAARSVVERNLTLAARDDIWNRAITHYQLGLLDWRAEANDDAERHLTEALTLQTDVGHRVGIAASLEVLAWVAVSRDEPTRAAQLLGFASKVFDVTGGYLVPALRYEHDHVTDVVRERLGPGRYRVLTESGAQMSPEAMLKLARREEETNGHELQPLTGRELEVADLVARGATNSEISFELMIAHETVKTHVRSILRKLGLTSRVQIGAWHSTRERDSRHM